MKFRSILKNHREFEQSIEDVIQYALDKIIVDLPGDKIIAKERNVLLEAFILKLCALWESFLEKEIVLSVSLDTKNLIETMELNKNKRLDTKLIRAILFSDTFRGFPDVNRLVNFAKRVIAEKYNPFFKITKEQKSKIHFTYAIRNYLSHYSSFSKKKLFSEYKRVFGYRNFLEPSKFLAKNKGKYFEDLANNFKIASVYMRKIFT